MRRKLPARPRLPKPVSRAAHRLPWFALAALCLAADLWTKHIVFYPLPESGPSARRHIATITSLPVEFTPVRS